MRRSFSTHTVVTVPLAAILGLLMPHISTAADQVFFSTNGPDGEMATASRPESNSQIEIETGDDFILDAQTSITSATFTGLLSGGAGTSDVDEVTVEIYRVFPKDSDANRTPKVPTRVNSPSDVALDSRDSEKSELTFTTTDLGAFTAANSVLNGIHPSPNQTTGGDGQVNGREVLFTVQFAKPFDLPADHYFFVPQVRLHAGQFYWLSAPKPIVAPGTPLSTDLQAWIRDANLDPDWLRIGTDIVGGTTPPTFNMAFSLSMPEPTPPPTETPPTNTTPTDTTGTTPTDTTGTTPTDTNVTPAGTTDTTAPSSPSGCGAGTCGTGGSATLALTLAGFMLIPTGGAPQLTRKRR